MEEIPAPAAQPVEAQATQAVEEVAVVMYCTDWCPACRRARAYLKVNNVSFREVNITRDREAAMRVRGWTGATRRRLPLTWAVRS